MQEAHKIFINIHGHRQANNIQEWVMMNMMAEDYPPEDVETGFYSVGLHPYSIGKVDEEDALRKVELATENPRVFAIGEIGLDKSIDPPLDRQLPLLVKQVEIAEYTELPVVLHVVGSFREMVDFMKSHRPSVPMIIHGFQGDKQLAGELLEAGFLLSFGEALSDESSPVRDALGMVPPGKLFLETDEGELDIREIYQITSGLKKVPLDDLRLQIFRNAKTHLTRFGDLFQNA